MQPANEKNILSTRNLSIGYSEEKIIAKNIEVSAQRGELICLIGANGTGKSTLLKTLCGQLPELSGEITLHEKNIHQLSVQDIAKEVAIVFTNKVNVEHLDVYSAIGMGRYPHTGWQGKLSQQDHQIIENTILATGLEQYTDRFLNQLSDGEQQKVMIARAIAQDCPVILLDEPTAYLDIINTIEITLLLKKTAKTQQKSVVMSTHDLNLALQVADKVWLMYNDSVKEFTVPQLLNSEEFDKTFRSSQFSFDKNTLNFKIDLPENKAK